MKVKIICLFSICLLLSSCFSYKQVEFVKIENIQMKGMSQDGLEAQVSVKIKNPNNYNIRVKSSGLQLSLDGKEVGNAVLSGIKIKKNSTETYTTNVKVKNIAPSFLFSIPSLSQKKSAKVGLKGTLIGRVGLFRKKFPIDVYDQVNLGNINH